MAFRDLAKTIRWGEPERLVQVEAYAMSTESARKCARNAVVYGNFLHQASIHFHGCPRISELET